MRKSSMSSIPTGIKKTADEFRGLLVHMKKMIPGQFRARLADLEKKLDRIEKGEKTGEKPMKCICRRKFKGFSTWFPHWRERHPVLHKRYNAVRGKKGERGRISLMLRMMRAASA